MKTRSPRPTSARDIALLFASKGVRLASDIVPAEPATDAEARAYYASLSDEQLEAMEQGRAH